MGENGAEIDLVTKRKNTLDCLGFYLEIIYMGKTRVGEFSVFVLSGN